MRNDQLARRLVAEFVVIVVGVFVGISLQEAWDASQLARASETYRADLLAEATEHRDHLENLLERILGRRRASLEQAATLLQSGQAVDSAETFLGDLLEAAMRGPTPRIYTATFDDLVSSGRFQTIDDRELRRDIARYYTVQTVQKRWDDEKESLDDSELLFRIVREAVPAHLVDRPTNGMVSVRGAHDEVRAAASRLVADSRLGPALSMHAHLQDIAVHYLGLMLSQAEEHVDRLEIDRNPN